jgi:hypothetical protein
VKEFAHLEMGVRVHEDRPLEEDHNDLVHVQDLNAHVELEDAQAIACDVEVQEEMLAPMKVQQAFVEQQRARDELEEALAFPGQQLKLIEIARDHLEESLQNFEKSEFCPSAIS